MSCSIYQKDRNQTERPFTPLKVTKDRGVVGKANKWFAHFPLEKSVWEFFSTSQEIPFVLKAVVWANQISLFSYIPTEISGILE